ncbi:hypothetical protein [Catenulispora rubra]|uniref:hypothetical protein n=1 Tax=Catenulispora rubra TaxID=280293 RepID=UPI0018927E0D|nr:hypothetical protein [Catenulispora rubra]
MLTKGRRAVSLTVLATAVTIITAGIASAGIAPVGGGGTCDKTQGTCTVEVGKPGSPGTTTTPTSTGGRTSGGSGGSNGATPSPEPTMINDSCVYAPDPTFTPQPGDGLDQHTGEKGGWYQMTCPDAVKLGTTVPTATTTTTEVWLVTPPPPALLKPTPVVLAVQAQQLLKLPVPAIASSPRPGLPQLVTMPTWAWLDPALLAPVSATASVPGESVTAVARARAVTWDFGDGTTVTCLGAGTPFPSGGDPSAASPDCGHTYTHSSGSGTLKITATIHWDVTWSGAGQAGAFAGMATTTSEQVVVEQSQALVTNG